MVSITKAMSGGPHVERIEIFIHSTKPIASILDDQCRVSFLWNEKYMYQVFYAIMI